MISAPFISLLMPVRNEAGFIEQGLTAVLTQDYPAGRMEVLVADGMSVDDTRAIIQRLASRYSQFPVKILDNPGEIVSVGMNIALRQAQGDIIVRVDGHCVIASDYVRRCVEYLQSREMDGVGGPMVTIGETPMAETISCAMSSHFGVGDSAFRTLHGRTLFADTVPFPAYTRQIIQKIGFYDEELIRDQDDEYNYRLRESGGKLLLAADVNSKYYSRGSLAGLWRQYFQYGYWKVRVLQKHPRQMSARHFVPPLFVLALCASLLIVLFPGVRIVSVLVPLSYLGVNIVASIRTAGKGGWRHLPYLPLVYSILHVSYGAGFIKGLVAFANRWGDKVGRTPSF